MTELFIHKGDIIVEASESIKEIFCKVLILLK